MLQNSECEALFIQWKKCFALRTAKNETRGEYANNCCPEKLHICDFIHNASGFGEATKIKKKCRGFAYICRELSTVLMF